MTQDYKKKNKLNQSLVLKSTAAQIYIEQKNEPLILFCVLFDEFYHTPDENYSWLSVLNTPFVQSSAMKTLL